MISVVIPAWNEAEAIPELYEQICCALAAIPAANERQLIFVDDGSTDDTAAQIDALALRDSSVQRISFGQNHGKAAALMAGFAAAEGEYVFTIDADLQDDPAEMPRFMNKLEEGYDLVSGWKQNRQDPLEKRLPSLLFNKVVSLTFGIPLHGFNCGFKLYRREVVKQLQLEDGLYRFIPVYAARMGFRIGELPVHHRKRQYGQSTYGPRRYLVGLKDYLQMLWQVKAKGSLASLDKPELLRYIVAGVAATAINLGGFMLLNALGVGYKISNAVALIACKVFAYVANKCYVFRSRSQSASEFFQELWRYVATRGLTGVLDYLLLLVSVDVFSWDKNISKLGIEDIVILMYYLLGRHVFFRKQQQGADTQR